VEYPREGQDHFPSDPIDKLAGPKGVTVGDQDRRAQRRAIGDAVGAGLTPAPTSAIDLRVPSQ
jgi:hypothetical protein